MTAEDLAPAWRFADPGRSVGSRNLEAADARNALQAAARIEGLEPVVGLRQCSCDEGRAELMGTSGNVHTDVLEALAGFLGELLLLLVGILQVLWSADLALEHPPTVEQQDHLVHLIEAADVAHPGADVDAELIGAIGREVVLDEHAAAGAERKSFDVERLLALRGAISRNRLGGVRITDRLRGDRAGRGDVLVEESRR